jgi:hypothetical protein
MPGYYHIKEREVIMISKMLSNIVLITFVLLIGCNIQNPISSNVEESDVSLSQEAVFQPMVTPSPGPPPTDDNNEEEESDYKNINVMKPE